MRVFLDATVFYSAVITPEGVNRDIFRVAEKRGDVLLLAHKFVWGEADMKLMFRGLWRERLQLQALVADQVRLCPAPPIELNRLYAPMLPDPNDVFILAGAVSAGADWLVTANTNDFEHLYGQSVGGVLVLEPREAIGRLTSGP